MNITTIQPNTLAEQFDIRAAIKRGEAVEANAIGNNANYPTGWIDMHIGPDHKPDFGLLRYRIKRLPEPEMVDSGPVFTTDRLSERELLAIMSAIIMGTGVDHFTSPASAVLSAKRILFSIDNPASNDYKDV